MTQDEVTWALETLKEDWPVDEFPEKLRRIHVDDPRILETGERKKRGELARSNFIRAKLTTRSPTPIGTEYDHEVSTVIGMRLEGAHVDKHGHIEDFQHFDQLVRYAQHALAKRRVFPTIDADDDIGKVDYFTALIENEEDLSGENRDYFRRDWDLRLVGDETLP